MSLAFPAQAQLTIPSQPFFPFPLTLLTLFDLCLILCFDFGRYQFVGFGHLSRVSMSAEDLRSVRDSGNDYPFRRIDASIEPLPRGLLLILTMFIITRLLHKKLRHWVIRFWRRQHHRVYR